MKRCLSLFCIILVLLVSSVAAQEAADKWFWAWDAEAGSLVSYTADGAANTLAESGVDGLDFNGWRIDDGSALALLTVEADARRLYRLTADEIIPVTFPDPQPSLDEGTYSVIARGGNDVVLAIAGRPPASAGLIVNLEANSAVVLPQEMLFYPRQSGFSADGRTFRYVGRDPEDEETWTIREYKLDTGTERVVATFEDEFFPLISTDIHGEQWIYQRAGNIMLIAISGEVEELEGDARMVRQIFGDHLLSYQVACIEDCELTWQSLVDDETLTFTFSFDAGFPTPIAQPDDEHLLVIADNTFWLLGVDGSAEAVGAWSPQNIVTPVDLLLSPDRRYLLVLDTLDSPDYHVHDLQTGESVLAGDPSRDYNILQIFYTDTGFILGENTRYYQFYRYSDGGVFDLGDAGGLFFDSAGDDALLVAQYRQDEERPRGIYRYELESGEFTPLVEGALPLYALPIREEM